jgi:hypothetical protein
MTTHIYSYGLPSRRAGNRSGFALRGDVHVANVRRVYRDMRRLGVGRGVARGMIDSLLYAGGDARWRADHSPELQATYREPVPT